MSLSCFETSKAIFVVGCPDPKPKRDVGGKAGAASVARMLERGIGDGEYFMAALIGTKPGSSEWAICV